MNGLKLTEEICRGFVHSDAVIQAGIVKPFIDTMFMAFEIKGTPLQLYLNQGYNAPPLVPKTEHDGARRLLGFITKQPEGVVAVMVSAFPNHQERIRDLAARVLGELSVFSGHAAQHMPALSLLSADGHPMQHDVAAISQAAMGAMRAGTLVSAAPRYPSESPSTQTALPRECHP